MQSTGLENNCFRFYHDRKVFQLSTALFAMTFQEYRSTLVGGRFDLMRPFQGKFRQATWPKK